MTKKNVGTIILDLTNDCMLRCEYCYINGGEYNDVLSVDNAVYAIEEFSNLFEYINVLFHGGEPLLCYENMCEIIEKCEKSRLANRLSYYIQTNGVLIDEEKCGYFKRHNVGVCISLDGFNDITNFARRDGMLKSSCQKSVDAVKLLRKYEMEVSLLSVLTKYNKDSIDLYLEKVEELGISSFAINPMTQAGRGYKKDTLAISAEETFSIYVRVLLWMIDRKEQGKENYPVERNIMYMLNKIFRNNSRFMCLNSPCGAGLSLWAVTATDEIYPCADFVSSPEFCVGRIKDGKIEKVTFNVLEQLCNVSLDNETACKGCTYKKYCPSGCSAKKYYHMGSVQALDPMCEFYKSFIQFVLDSDKSRKIEEFYKS